MYDEEEIQESKDINARCLLGKNITEKPYLQQLYANNPHKHMAQSTKPYC